MEDVEVKEGDPTGDRLRVVVLSGPDQVLRYALRFLPSRRHSFFLIWWYTEPSSDLDV